jgi:hypothetical protein
MRVPCAVRIVASLLASMALLGGSGMSVARADPQALRPAQASAPLRDVEAELLGLRLLNCTRTGGWVRADGTCKGRGTGQYSPYVRPLRLDDGISDEVAFPWAADLVVAGVCDHTLPGEPALGERLASAGFQGSAYGENVGCGWGGMTAAEIVVAVHRAMQAEKASQGGHWQNMKQRTFRRVGIGVATLDDRVTIVFDFYRE